jgi:putative spermidine/putrescine transport system substrate-binding protein
MILRRLVAAAVLTALAPLACAEPVAPPDLSVMLHDQGQVPAWQAVFLHPFTEATGITASAAVWTGQLADLQKPAKGAKAEKPDPVPVPDLVMAGPNTLAAGCSAGVFEKLDWSQIGGKDHYLPMGVSDCGVGATVSNLVLAWDHSKLKTSPNWADFWDVTKYPGKRGLHMGVRGNLEIALLADGVAPADIYKTLGTSDGVDRAFRKLDQLRPYIVWWKTPADAAKILASGDVLMTSAPSPAIAEAGRSLKRDFGVQWGGGLYDVLSFAIPKGAAHQRAAVQFLYFQGTPAIESRLVDPHGFGGMAKGANDGLAPGVAAMSPTLPANLQAGLKVDDAFWQANLTKLQARFDKWLAQK